MALPRPLPRASVAALRGVGQKTVERLEKLGIHSLQDLLFHLPLRYEDRTAVIPLGRIRHGGYGLVEGRIDLAEIVPKGRRSLVCRMSDGTGCIYLRFFYFTAEQRQRLQPGVRVRCYGEAKEGFFGLEMAHPDYQLIVGDESAPVEASLTPVYPLTEGLHQKTLRKLAAQALAQYASADGDTAQIADWIPSQLLAPFQFPSLSEALHLLHMPPKGVSSDVLAKAQRRLAFEELLAHHLGLSRFRLCGSAEKALAIRMPDKVERTFLDGIPFALTGAQRRVIGELAADLNSGRPMMRLVQGDVGSGKTIVAAWAALAALSCQSQVAIMAPTELLAEQHYYTFKRWLDPLEVRLAFLTGKHKGAVRRELLKGIAVGETGIVLGTHALFQDDVRFQRLGLIVIDEQHRFGVHQRLALREKGLAPELAPHQLVMTATPIPRTLAMLGYADLDVSVIDELPPGRTQVKTSVVPAGRREEVVERIAAWVAQGRQVYWVCTLIEESELLQCEAAEKTAQLLTEWLPHVRIALIHGRMKATAKDAVMEGFKDGRIDLLVATTVIEVGVDVPNASLMVIENPERLGLAQLHQLRGRVGRGPAASHCVLLYQAPLSASAKERLAILRESSDGFYIAERDLALRGPGELLGVRQTGQLQFRIADFARDADLLDQVKVVSDDMLRSYPNQVEPLLERWMAGSARFANV